MTAQLLAGILFAFGGISGITNASYSLNLVIHNTTWVPGHFHLTVASAVTLSFMGISYWLVPHLTGRALWKPKLAVVQGWVWFVGMLIFSNAMHVLGLLGAPRRTALGQSPYVPDDWNGALFRVAVGGAILLVSAVLYVLIMIRTSRNPERAEVAVPIAESIQDPQMTPGWLDNWKGWLIATGSLILLSYGPQIISQVSNAQFNAPGIGG